MFDGLKQGCPGMTVSRRDVSEGLPWVDAAWVNANLTEPEARSESQRQARSASDSLVAEVMDANVWVIATPLYNFGVAASFKAWIDPTARARVSIPYTEQGPEDLLVGKKVYILTATGGTGVGSAVDFVTPWIKSVLGFMGVTDAEVIAADRGMLRGNAAREAAAEPIDRVFARDWPARAAA